jgi:hypothetical protein
VGDRQSAESAGPRAARILASALGEQRVRELRAEGSAMDEDQAVAYTLAQIDSTLAEVDHPTPRQRTRAVQPGLQRNGWR